MMTWPRVLVVLLALALAVPMAWASWALVTGYMFENGQRFGMIVTGWLAVAFVVFGAWKAAK